MSFRLVPFLGTLAISGCIVVSDDVTTSGFGAPPSGLNNVETETIGNGFGTATLVIGTDGDGAAAYAGLLTTTTGSPLPASDVTYSGVYEVIGIENIRSYTDLFGPDFIEGNTFSDSGTLTLVADVSANALNGTDGTFTVIGTLSGIDLSGSVSYDGQAGVLDGALYAEGGVAVFHGNDDDRVFAGGLTMIEDP